MGEETTGGDAKVSRRKLYIGIACIVAFVIALVILLCFILRLSKPSFNLQEVTVYNFNVSTEPPCSVTINMQVTLNSTNPNSNYGVVYRSGTDLYAEYRGQQITYASLLPETYQGHREIVAWSPFLNADVEPISPYNGESLARDLNAGTVMINIKLNGKLKWKLGSLTLGKHHLHVVCPASIRFGDLIINDGVAVRPAVIKGQPMDRCSVATV